ncbi:hypothetical protein X772_34910 [Mesorhizobium sp. LSJC280B00]|nr:hypothetical protein X772_34910 [Mesorhizobium sp. LSJC280B00]
MKIVGLAMADLLNVIPPRPPAGAAVKAAHRAP